MWPAQCVCFEGHGRGAQRAHKRAGTWSDYRYAQCRERGPHPLARLPSGEASLPSGPLSLLD